MENKHKLKDNKTGKVFINERVRERELRTRAKGERSKGKLVKLGYNNGWNFMEKDKTNGGTERWLMDGYWSGV